MLKKLLSIAFCISLTLLLSACGGGGGGGNSDNSNHAPSLSAIANVSMVSGNSKVVTLAASDPDGDSIFYSVSGGSDTTVSANISGNVLTLTPASGYVTTTPVSLTVTANDSKGGIDSKTFTVSVSAATQALLKVSTANVPTGTLVGSVQISIVLPSGVSPSVLSGNDATGSVAASGNASPLTETVASGYDSTTRTLTPGTISGNGFVSGEFLTITCSIANGTTVSAAGFPPLATVVDIRDTNGTPITGATSPISVTFQ